MFIVIGIMFGGIAAGYALRKAAFIQKTGNCISYTILALLFLLGLSAGGNRALIHNLPALGGQALLIAFAGTLGSVLAAWAVYHCFFKKKKP
ncbi:MAG: LysO family transporter [Tannerellaceae bacterium]|jgi:uncharacterized membrane protein YbjE (DUF340 family)|nr:LysO family transporter [Tannerellaceae bacterium]